MADSRNSDRMKTQPSTWTASRRFWVSLIVAFHLFCVFLAPMAVVEPRSSIAYDLQSVFHPYTQSLFLDHGYRFFAPEPGPSHIVRYEIVRRNGETVAGHFPDRKKHWPRLLYHRWFMLSETVFMHVSETLDPKQLGEWRKQIEEEIRTLVPIDPRSAESLEFQLRRELAEHERVAAMRDRLVTNLGHFLLRRYDGVSVRMQLVTRTIPAPEEVLRGTALDNDRFLPEDLQYDLGAIKAGGELESITPLETDSVDNEKSQK